MKNNCFIIMPISDNSNYTKGHFQRVYEHIIKPACLKANFNPIRADDMNSTNHIALDIIKKIIESDMALCDLSSRNPNVLYELGIRQAFNKPVTLIKDLKTNRIFDIQGFRDIEYDEKLRIDNVNEIIKTIAESLINTYEQKETEINSLVKLLGINPAEVGEKTNISFESELILNNLIDINKRLSAIESRHIFTPKSEYTNLKSCDSSINKKIEYDDFLSLKELRELQKGDKVEHSRLGVGTINEIIKNIDNPNNSVGKIIFEDGGIRNIVLRFAKLKKHSPKK